MNDDVKATTSTEDQIKSGPLPFGSDAPKTDTPPVGGDELKNLPPVEVSTPSSPDLPPVDADSPPPSPNVTGPDLPPEKEVKEYEAKASGDGPIAGDVPTMMEPVKEEKGDKIKLSSGKRGSRKKIVGAILALIVLVIGGGFTVIGARNYLETGRFDIRPHAAGALCDGWAADGSTHCNTGSCHQYFCNNGSWEDRGTGGACSSQPACQSTAPAPTQAPATSSCSGAKNCSVTCANGRKFSDACPGNGSFGSCTQWANQACGTVGSVPSGSVTAAPTATGGGGSGTCGTGSHQACVGKAPGAVTFGGVAGSCFFNGTISGVQVCGWLPTSGCITDGNQQGTGLCCSGHSVGGVCTPSGASVAPTATPTITQGGCTNIASETACKLTAGCTWLLSGRCTGTPTGSTPTPSVITPPPTSSGGGGSTGSCGSSGQSCCDPFSSGGKICNSGLYCNSGTCGSTPASNICSGSQGAGGTPNGMCAVYTCGSQCNNGNQCNLNRQVVPCSEVASRLAGQCGQADYLNQDNNYCGVQSQNCGGSCAGSTGGGGPVTTAAPTTPPAVTTQAAGMCVATKLYAQVDGTWTAMTPAQLGAAVKPGDTIRISVKGSGKAFTSGRFRIKVGDATYGDWVVSSTKNTSGEYYINYPIPSAGTFSVQGQVL